MPEEIKKLDMNKYLVLKIEDIEELCQTDRDNIEKVCDKIRINREKKGKPENQYLVLNLDDDIDWDYLTNWRNVVHPDNRKLKVKDISVALVNAVLKAKGETSELQNTRM